MHKNTHQDANYIRRHSQPPYWYDYVKMLKPSDEPLLELGCGSAWLGQYVSDYTGLDISPAAVAMAKKRGLCVHLASLEEALAFPDHSFACVFIKDVLEHLRNPAQAVSEIMRVLKAGGRCIAFVPAAQSWVWDDYTHVRPYTKTSLRSIFADCGAKVEKISYEPIMPGIGRLCRLLRMNSRPWPFWLLAKLPFMRRNIYIIAAKQ